VSRILLLAPILALIAMAALAVVLIAPAAFAAGWQT
jgi:hypothetical protein